MLRQFVCISRETRVQGSEDLILDDVYKLVFWIHESLQTSWEAAIIYHMILRKRRC